MPNVRVVVRCRPSTLDNSRHGNEVLHSPSSSPWSFDAQTIRLSTGGQDASHGTVSSSRRQTFGASSSPHSTAPTLEKAFQFNRVYALGETQESFFNAEVRPLLNSALGNNTTSSTTVVQSDSPVENANEAPRHVVLFAYGQTGSGKTHTVDGQRAATTASKEERAAAGAPTDPKPLTRQASGQPKDNVTEDRDDDGDFIEEQEGDEDHQYDENPSSSDTTAAQQQHQQRAAEGVAPRALRYIFDSWKDQRRSKDYNANGDLSMASSLLNSNDGGVNHDDAVESGATCDGFELVKVSVSFLEIYNEKLYDLLSATCRTGAGSPQDQLMKKKKKASKVPTTVEALAAMHATSLRLRRCPDASAHGPAKFEVENLTKLSCVTVDEALEYYYYAVSKKIFRAHNLNSQSSRAHSIFTIYLTFRDLSGGASGVVPGGASAFDGTLTGGGGRGILDQASFVTSEIAIVDLAGSERLHSILPQGHHHDTLGSNATNHNSQRPPASPRHSAGTAANSFGASHQQQQQRPSSGPVGGGNVYLEGIRKQQQQTALITESIHINKSLLTLGKVIMALSSGSSSSRAGGGSTADPQPPTTPLAASARGNSRGVGTPRGGGHPTTTAANRSTTTAVIKHTPFRDSKLTMVMNHALGGNALTVMVACIHTDPSQVHESLSTLFYATRTNKIANVVVSLEDPKTQRIKSLLAEVQRLKGELQASQTTIEDLSMMLAKGNVRGGVPGVDRGDSGQQKSVAYQKATTPAAEVGHDPKEETDGAVKMNSDHTIIHEEQKLLTDTLSSKLHEACLKLKTALEANTRLRSAFDVERQRSAAIERDQERMLEENLRLREKLDLYDSLLLAQIAINRQYDEKGDTPSSRNNVSAVADARKRCGKPNLRASAAGIESLTAVFFQQQKKLLTGGSQQQQQPTLLSPRVSQKLSSHHNHKNQYSSLSPKRQTRRSYDTHETLHLTSSSWSDTQATTWRQPHSQLVPSPPPASLSYGESQHQQQQQQRPASASTRTPNTAATPIVGGGSFRSGLPLHLLVGGSSQSSSTKL